MSCYAEHSACLQLWELQRSCNPKHPVQKSKLQKAVRSLDVCAVYALYTYYHANNRTSDCCYGILPPVCPLSVWMHLYRNERTQPSLFHHLSYFRGCETCHTHCCRIKSISVNFWNRSSFQAPFVRGSEVTPSSIYGYFVRFWSTCISSICHAAWSYQLSLTRCCSDAQISSQLSIHFHFHYALWHLFSRRPLSIDAPATTLREVPQKRMWSSNMVWLGV